jgi:hypothetical protein
LGLTFKNPNWLFDSVKDLKERERLRGTSLGALEPKEIIGVKIEQRGEEEQQTA